MANSIALISKYGAEQLDEVFVRESVTGILENKSGIEIRQSFVNAQTVFIPDITLSGLGQYDRALGFPEGSATLTWTPYTLSQDRGIEIPIDNMDDEETAGVLASNLLLLNEKKSVIPEVDAYRLSTLAGKAKTVVVGALENNKILELFAAADKALEDEEVGLEDVVYFVSTELNQKLKTSSELNRLISNAEMKIGDITLTVKTFDSRPIVVVPPTRFKTLYTFYTGRESGTAQFGFASATNSAAINLMAVHYNAALPIKKHAPVRVFTPEQNQDKDGWKFQTRIYHDIFVPKNKTVGIYLHKKAATDITITFDPNESTASGTVSGTTAAMTNQTEGSTITLTAEGYTAAGTNKAFKGWALTKTGAVKYADALATFVVPSKDITL